MTVDLSIDGRLQGIDIARDVLNHGGGGCQDARARRLNLHGIVPFLKLLGCVALALRFESLLSLAPFTALVLVGEDADEAPVLPVT